MRWVWVALGLLVVVGCAKKEVKLPASVATPVADKSTYATEHPAEYWDEAIKNADIPGMPTRYLPATATLLVQNARKLMGTERARAIDENIARFREGIPILAKAPDVGSAAQEVRCLLAQSAIDANDMPLARQTAEEALAANTDPKDEAYGDVAHDMNLVLASVAHASSNDGEARRRVLQASRTPGSTKLNAFGPKFQVVYELYKNGDRDLMLQYLTNVKKFWKSDLPGFWQKSFESGKEPTDGLWKLATNS